MGPPNEVHPRRSATQKISIHVFHAAMTRGFAAESRPTFAFPPTRRLTPHFFLDSRTRRRLP